MRVFAGPNGSGKTTIFKGILAEKSIQLGIFVNADEIEQMLHHSGVIDFSAFNIRVRDTQLKDFFVKSTFSPIKRHEPDLYKKISVIKNLFSTTAKIDSYLAADLADFIREQLLKNNISFTYETVMSHPDKIHFLTKALKNGYRVYLYFVATEDPEINIARVNVRVAQHGHAVAANVIKNRYYKSLGNLKQAVSQTSRAYIFDNSQKQANLIAEITDGTEVALNTDVELPYWVVKNLLN